MGNKDHDNKKMKDKDNPKSEIYGFAVLSGRIRGYKKNQYTREIPNSLIHLKIHVRDDHNKEHVLDPLVQRDLERLLKEYPDIYQTITEYHGSFQPVLSQDGFFALTDIPIGWWCYIVCARVEKKDYDITQKLGNNGFGKAMEIPGKELQAQHNIEGIIVPVEDIWYKTAPPKTDDPNTTTFVRGMRR